MRISDLIPPAAIAVGVQIDGKAQALKLAASSLGAISGLDPERIRQALASREALGSTGIGHGVALPHVCFQELDRSYALLQTLAVPIDFDSIDDQPVDIICTIISPASAAGGGSLTCLAAVARVLRDSDRAEAIRKANSSWAVYDIISEPATSPARIAS